MWECGQAELGNASMRKSARHLGMRGSTGLKPLPQECVGPQEIQTKCRGRYMASLMSDGGTQVSPCRQCLEGLFAGKR